MADIDLTQGQSLPEGTVTRYQDQLDGTHALLVGLGALGQTVTVTRVNPGEEPTDLGKAEDQLFVSGDVGVMALAVRNDSRTQAPLTDTAYGPMTIDDQGSTLVHITADNVPATWASAVISGNTSGDNELVAAILSQGIYIVGITLVAAGAVNVTLEGGTGGNDLTGLMVMAAAGDTIVWPVAGHGWYARTNVGESLNMRLSGAVFVTGIVTYFTT